MQTPTPQPTLHFFFDTNKPVFLPGKGGWVWANYRAAAVVYYSGGSFLGKRILEGANDDLCPTDVGRPTTGGVIVESTNGTVLREVTLNRGVYRIELAGSKGGDGGAGDLAGGAGARGGYLNTVIYIDHPVTAVIGSAQKGDNGQDGGYDDGSDDPDGRVGGGGGGGGGSAFFIVYSLLIYLFAFGGGGGGGGGCLKSGSTKDDSGGSGGGGGGGGGDPGRDGAGAGNEHLAGAGGIGGSGSTAGKGGTGGKAGAINDPVAIPEGGAGYGHDDYKPPYTIGCGGSGGGGGHGQDASGSNDGTAGGDGKPGGNSVNAETGGATSDNGFARIYRIAGR